MCVFNGEKHLAEAVRSILDQTFGDFEFVIVDDGSTDTTAQILDSFDDPRIVRLTNPQNIGIPKSANRGLEAARAPYIARMDADDVCAKNRLEVQHAFMESHPGIGMVATSFTVIEPTGEVRGQSEIPDAELLPWVMLWANCIGQPSVMMRRSALAEVGNYDTAMSYAEDYDMWCRFLMGGHGIATLKYSSFLRRKSPLRASVKHSAADECVRNILRRYLAWIIGQPVAEEALSAFLKFSRRSRDTTLDDFRRAVKVADGAFRAALVKTQRKQHPAVREIFAAQMLRWADLLDLSRSPGSRKVALHALRYAPAMLMRRLFWTQFRRKRKGR
jgi:cellulose synthase/poly-beta-1,6-N-acetylglucosamine synthase-like glycosyltransferase